LAQLLQQACVLDSDNSFVRERAHQRDLAIRERSGAQAPDRDHAGSRSVAQQRHAQERADTDIFQRAAAIGGILQRVGDVERLPGLQRAADD